MDILTYPIGLLIGLLPVVVDLGSLAQPARLVLDGHPACTLTAESPSCLVDLGMDSRIHLLELERTDRGGNVTDRVRRWINRPGIDAEVRAAGACDQARRECEFAVGWAHPYRLDPMEVTVSLDGQIVYRGAAPRTPLKAPFPGTSPPQLVTAEAIFEDGRTATSARLLRADHPETAEALLHSVPIVLVGGSAAEPDPAARLREAGWSVRSVEKADPDVVFVVEPLALQRVAALVREARVRGTRSNAVLARSASVQLIVADESLKRYDAFSAGGPANWLAALFAVSHDAGTARRVRTADAVATAGFLLGSTPRPRAVVLVLSDRERDSSSFSPEQARRYLSETLAPLVVWRVGDALAPEWPMGSHLRADHDLYDCLVSLGQELGAQRVAWLEGSVETAPPSGSLPSSIAFAGRVSFAAAPGEIPPSKAAPAGGVLAGRSVFALALDPGESTRFYAGTDAGLFQSDDEGQSWKPASPSVAVSVYGIAFALSGGRYDPVLATSGRLARRSRDGTWTSYPTDEVLSVLADPADPATLYAGIRNGVLKSGDAGTRWVDSSRGLPGIFALALAADPRHRETLYAATAGDGVYGSTDGGGSWALRGVELRRTVVRCLALDPANSDHMYAGTDGGVFESANGGRNWSLLVSGPARTPVYALALDPGQPARVWAGTAEGLFESRDAGKSWSRSGAIEPAVVTSLLPDGSRRSLLVGTLWKGLWRVSLDEGNSLTN